MKTDVITIINKQLRVKYRRAAARFVIITPNYIREEGNYSIAIIIIIIIIIKSTRGRDRVSAY
jgi:hypothetical protein